jgi:NAD kinase
MERKPPAARLFTPRDAFLITPICLHMLTNRPLVIPDTPCVEIDIAAAEKTVYLTLDGQVGFQFQPKDRVIIMKQSSRVYFVESMQKTYFNALLSKLRWVSASEPGGVESDLSFWRLGYGHRSDVCRRKSG